MKFLIIGGTYFLGRVFCMLAGKKNELTLVNRGNYDMKDYAFKQYHFDRHDSNQWQKLSKEHYDVIIDFCAYDPHDIEIVVNNYFGSFDRYILISTVDVCKHHLGIIKNENAPLETSYDHSKVSTYIQNKIKLEAELRNLANTYHFKTSIIRPGNIYGPYNYAPRESQYISMVISGLPLIIPKENNGYFQLVYVKDVARAILMICENACDHQVYHIVAPEILNYETFYQTLNQISEMPIEVIKLSYKQACQMQYPFCYSVFKEETELYDGSLFTKDYNFKYTPFNEGMAKTYQAFYPVFSSKS